MRPLETLYLIGPSGVGKTTCADAAVERINAKHYKLDDLCRRRTNDWHFCQQVMRDAEASNKTQGHLKIIDIGAGTQHDCNRELVEYLNARRDSAMLIWAPDSEVIMRNPLGSNRNQEEYRRTEYTSRDRLYSIPAHRIDISGMSTDEACDHFVLYLTGEPTFPPRRRT